jgi:hypothetical protein
MPRQPKKRRSVPLIARDVTPPTLTSLSGNCMLRIGRSEGTTGITGITSLANEQGHCRGVFHKALPAFAGMTKMAKRCLSDWNTPRAMPLR